MNLQEKAEGKGKSTVVQYCDVPDCRGVDIEAEVPEDGSTECQICFCSFESSRMVVLFMCMHRMCEDCHNSMTEKRCPFCRQATLKAVKFDRDLIPTREAAELKEHVGSCMRPSYPRMAEHLSHVGQPWRDLAEYMFATQASRSFHYGIKGTEHLKLARIAETGRMVEKSDWHVTYMTEEWYLQVAFSILLPNLSIRLVVSKRDDFAFPVDNEAADEVVGHLLRQMRRCWKVTPYLMNQLERNHLFVRKFDEVTCVLMLMGGDNQNTYRSHYMLMADELMSMKPSNFDSVHYGEVARTLPPLLLSNQRVARNYNDFDCQCCHFEIPAWKV